MRTSSSRSSSGPAWRCASGCPASTTSRCGRRCASRSIRLVGVRHEQAAAYAADGYARATGRLGVALTTTGPGAANTLGAVGEAWASRSPILVIATDIPSTLRRPGEYRGVLHETDGPGGDVRAGREVDARRAGRGARSRRRRRRRSATAIGRADAPGLPGDRDRPAGRRGARGDGAARSTSRRRRGRTSPRRSRRSTRAERPLLWVGGGARDAAAEVAALAERLGAPVLTTYGAAGVLPPGHPCLVGLPPHVEPAGRLWDEADVVLAIGSDLDGVQTQNFAQPQPPTLIAVALEPPIELPRRRRADRRRGRARRRARRARRSRATATPRRGSPRRAREACGALDATALRFLDAIRFARPRRRRRSSSTCASRATGSPASTRPPRRAGCRSRSAGARSATPSRPRSAPRWPAPARSSRSPATAASCSPCGELATMAQEQIPLTAVIVDDGGYGMLRYDQVMAGEETYGVDLHTPDFAALADAFGVARGDRRRPRRRLRRGARPPRRRPGPSRPRRPHARSRSSRRRTRRRTGTAGELSGDRESADRGLARRARRPAPGRRTSRRVR